MPALGGSSGGATRRRARARSGRQKGKQAGVSLFARPRPGQTCMLGAGQIQRDRRRAPRYGPVRSIRRFAAARPAPPAWWRQPRSWRSPTHADGKLRQQPGGRRAARAARAAETGTHLLWGTHADVDGTHAHARRCGIDGLCDGQNDPRGLADGPRARQGRRQRVRAP